MNIGIISFFASHTLFGTLALTVIMSSFPVSLYAGPSDTEDAPPAKRHKTLPVKGKATAGTVQENDILPSACSQPLLKSNLYAQDLSSANALWQQGRQAHRAGQYEVALYSFNSAQSILSNCPELSQTSKANLNYSIGESFFALKLYVVAKAYFQRALDLEKNRYSNDLSLILRGV